MSASASRTRTISRLHIPARVHPNPTLRCALTGRQRMVRATVTCWVFDVGLFHSFLHAGCPALSTRGSSGLSDHPLLRRPVGGRLGPSAPPRSGPDGDRHDGARRALRHLQRWSVLVVCAARSEEHTSELQSLRHLVCRLLLEKTK